MTSELSFCATVDPFNNARANVSLRVVNPSINIHDNTTDYVIEPSKFQETLAPHSTYQKTIKDAAPRRLKQVFSKDFFTQGSGGSPISTSDCSTPNQTRRSHDVTVNQSRAFNNHRPNRNTSNNNSNSTNNSKQ
jgi:hypothetical protein